MTEGTKVLKIFESFVLGKCRCGCNEDIDIIVVEKKYLKKYKRGHFLKGERHYNWKNGRRLRNGYIQILNKQHPFCDSHSYVFEHRLVMEKHLGRYLTREEEIHHKDGNTQNNTIENLQLFENHSNHLKKDMSNRLCLSCNKKTYITKKGHERWFRYKNGFNCRNCHRKLKKNGGY